MLSCSSLAQEGRVVYFQDFGCNDVDSPIISTLPIKECQLPQVLLDGSFSGSYAVRKRAFVNNNRHGESQWYAQIDHTHPEHPDVGCFLQVDGSLDHQIFYTFVIADVPNGAQLEISLWTVNLYTAYQKENFQKTNWPIDDPDLDLIIFDAAEKELARYRIGPLLPDSTLTAPTDFVHSARWQNHTFDFRLTTTTPYLIFAIGNRTVSSPGNDFGIDDIVVKTQK